MSYIFYSISKSIFINGKKKSAAMVLLILLCQWYFPLSSMAQAAQLADSINTGNNSVTQPTANLPSEPGSGDTVINSGATHVFDFSNSSNLNVINNLVNMGTIYTLSTNAAVTSGTITANNIFNYPGATITSILPAGGLPGYANAVGGFNFTLNAANNIINAGNISSAGSLNLVAGNSIINALPAGVIGPSPVIQAMGDLSLTTANFANMGAIASINNNININSSILQNIVINATGGGTFSALNGAINIRDTFFSGKFDTTLLSGDWLSQTLNINSGSGNILGDVGLVSGVINANCANIMFEGHGNYQLNLGSINFTDDPVMSDLTDGTLTFSLFNLAPFESYSASATNIIASVPIVLSEGSRASLTAAKTIDIDSIQMAASSKLILSGLDVNTKTLSMTGGPTDNLATVDIFGTNSIKLDNSTGAGILSLWAAKVTTGNLATTNISLDGFDSAHPLATLAANSLGASGGYVAIGFESNSPLNYGSSIGSINASDITLINYGTGGVTIASPLIVSGSAEEGINNLNIACYDGPVSINAPIYAGHNPSGDSGRIGIYANSVSLNADIVASGIGNGRGGFLNITANSIDVSGGNLYAAGGAAGSRGGNINLTTPTPGETPFTISGTNLNCNADGYFGRINIYVGDLRLENHVSLNADAIVDGTGGTVNVISSYGAVKVGQGIGEVSLSARGGIAGGGGGTAYIYAGTNANIDTNSIDVSAVIGDGGSVSFYAGQVNSPNGKLSIIGNVKADAGYEGFGGYVTMQAPHIDFAGATVQQFSANGAGAGSGGSVSLTSTYGYTVATGSPLLSANGGTSGSGGYVELISTDLDANISIGNSGSGDIRLSATGGSMGSAAGGGGTIHVRAGGDLTVRPQNVNVNSKGTQGNGGNVQLIAGFQSSSYEFNGTEFVETFQFNDTGTLSLLSTGTLSSSADGAGNGGSIDLQAPMVNIASNINANAGTEGTGGKIHIESHSVSADSLTIGGSATVSLLALGGTTGGDGGIVSVHSGGDIGMTATTINASARSTALAGNGGSVEIASVGDLSYTGNVRANAGLNGGGGDITIESESANSKVAIGNGVVQTTIAAQGGADGGSGGMIEISSENTISINTANINANARDEGNGGSIAVQSTNDLTLSSKIHTDGGSVGNGGTIRLVSSEGVVSIRELSDGSHSLLTARGGSVSGIGSNDVTISAGADLIVDRALLSAAAQFDGTGGNITLTSGTRMAGDLNFTGTIIADGEGEGNDGGTITVKSQTGDAIFNHPVETAEVLSAQGGALASFGNGGTINISAFGDLNLESGTVHASSLAESGNGGTINLKSGISGTGNLAYKFDIKADGGNIVGSGGNVTLEQASVALMQVYGNIIANGVGDNPGGVITFKNNGNNDFNLTLAGKEIADGKGKIQISGLGSSTINVDITGKVDAGRDSNTELGAIGFSNGTESNVSVFSSDGKGIIKGDLEITASNISISLPTALSIGTLNATGLPSDQQNSGNIESHRN